MPSTPEQLLPTVSVIIPTYNRARYLQEALESILLQTLPALEIIVVDDGSTDNTEEVVQCVEGPVRLLRQEHLGVVAARNFGLREATGDLIAWLDSDDLWEPQFLATTVGLLADHPELDGVYCGWTHIDPTGHVLPTPELRVVSSQELYSALTASDFIMTPAIVAYKRCYDQVGPFDMELRICEDYDMWLRLAQTYAIFGMPQPLVRIRVHGDSEIMRDRVALCEYRLALTRKHFGPREGDPSLWTEEKRRAHAFALQMCALMYIEDGDSDAGWKLLTDAVFIWPALLDKLDVFYELACGAQPRGYRGRADLLDIDASGRELLGRLAALFESAGASLDQKRGRAYSNAYLALGMLSDQAGQWTKARRYLVQAMTSWPALAVSPSVILRFAKLCSGQKLVNFVRRRKASDRGDVREGSL